MRALALLLAVVLSPGVAEVTEDFAHWFAEGHTVHASAQEHEARGETTSGDTHASDEHGCSALFHVCGCHTPAPSMVTARLALSKDDELPVVEATAAFAQRSRRPPDGVHSEAFRPPIA